MKAILFDFDGVIVDSMKLHAKSWQSTFKKHGMAIEENTVYGYEGMLSLEIATKLCFGEYRWLSYHIVCRR